jgi:hypothetical protein
VTGPPEPTEDVGATRPVGSYDAVVSPPPTEAYTPPAPMPQPQLTERIQLPPDRRSTVAQTVAIAFVVAALIGGAIAGFVKERPNTKGVVAQALVGPEGGSLTFADGGRVEIPAGALPSPTKITIRQLGLERPVRLERPEDGQRVVLQPDDVDMYSFEPVDLRFQVPVVITLPVSGEIGSLLIDASDGVRVVPGELRDGTLTVETQSFDFP